MLKFTAEGKDGKIYFFGMSRGNVDRLVAGQPVKINLQDMGGPQVSIVIIFGETERLLFNSLRSQGLIPSDINFHEAEVGTAEVVRWKRESDQSNSPGRDLPWPDCEGK